MLSHVWLFSGQRPAPLGNLPLTETDSNRRTLRELVYCQPSLPLDYRSLRGRCRNRTCTPMKGRMD